LFRAQLQYTTTSGGSFDRGTVFKVGIDGNGFELLHSFTTAFAVSNNNDGFFPQGRLVSLGKAFMVRQHTEGL